MKKAIMFVMFLMVGIAVASSIVMAAGENVTCIDTDAGAVYSAIGTTQVCTDSDCLTYTDSCSAAMLTEYSCNVDVLAQEDFLCEFGCKEGACVLETDALCEISVNVEGDDVFEDDTIRIALNKGDEIFVTVKVMCPVEKKDVQMQSFITGYEHGSITDSTDVFDVRADTRYKKVMQLEIPDDLEVAEYNDGEYKLRVVIADRDGKTESMDYDLLFEADRHNVVIRDILLNPSRSVVAGRGLIAEVRLKNYGQKDEEGVKVTVSMPELEIEDSDYVDDLEAEDSVTSEDLFLRIPKCTEPGTYTVFAEVEFNDGYDSITDQTTIRILEDESCNFDPVTGGSNDGTTTSGSSPQTVITVPNSMVVKTGGQAAVYPIIIKNSGFETKQYTLSVSGQESWGRADFEGGALAIIAPKTTEVVYLYVIANEGAMLGDKVFVVDVKSRTESQSVPLTATVIQGASTTNGSQNMSMIGTPGVTGTLQLALVGLIIILILLGIFAGFQRMG